MTINIADNSARISYSVAEGVTQTSFAVPFEFFDNPDLNVYLDGTLQTITTNYTVSGGDGSTGTVTMSVTGASGGSTVVITRDIELERTTDFPVSGAFNIVALNTELDRLVAIAADLDDRAARAIQAQDFDSTVSYTLPLVDDRKGKVLGFNATTGAVEAGPEIADTESLADVSADIALLADIEDGTTDTNAITNVNGIRTDVTTVSGISANVTTVANNDANVTTVATNDANVTTVASNIASVNTVATNIADVITVANDLNEAISEVETVANDLNESISEIETVAGSIANVDIVGTDIANVNTTAGSISNVNTTATNIANVNTVAGISGNVTTVAGISSDVTTVAADQTDIGTVSTNIANVNTVAGISGNVTTVAGISGNVTTVANNDANVTTVAGINSAVSTVAGISTDVTAVSNNNANVTTVAGSIANVNTAATDITNINTAATNISVINTVATAITDVSTVSADIAAVITAANDLNEAVSEIETVANAITNVDTVGTNITNVNTVAGISSDVTTVANDGTDIGTVATNIANVNTVAGISGNVTTVAGISTDVTAVAADASDIGTVSTDIANVNTVAGSISNVNTVATNINNVNDFFNVYRVGSTDPTTSLDTGDLFYNTTTGSLKVYTGSAWEQGVTAGSGFLPLAGGTLTGTLNGTAASFSGSITGDLTGNADTATTLASLTSDPNDDRIVFWDDSANDFAYLDIGSNLTLSGTTLSADAQSPIAGTGINVSGQTVSLDSGGTVGAGTYGSTSNGTKIDEITVDAYGRVTAITTGGTGDINTVTAGTGLTGGGSSGGVTLSLDGTGTVGAGTYGSTANGTKIDNITVDAYGRVTAVTTGATGDLTGDGAFFEADVEIYSDDIGADIDLKWFTGGTGSYGGGLSFLDSEVEEAYVRYTPQQGSTPRKLESHVDGDLSISTNAANSQIDITANGSGSDINITAADNIILDGDIDLRSTGTLTLTSDNNVQQNNLYAVNGIALRATYVNGTNNYEDRIYSTSKAIYPYWFSRAAYLGAIGNNPYGWRLIYMRDPGTGSDNLIRSDQWNAFSLAVPLKMTSDERIKEDIQEIENPIDKINQLNGYTYTWTTTRDKDAGVIAQEVEKVMPELVAEIEGEQNDEGFNRKTVNYNGLVGLLISAVKEQQKQIDELKAKIEEQ